MENSVWFGQFPLCYAFTGMELIAIFSLLSLEARRRRDTLYQEFVQDSEADEASEPDALYYIVLQAIAVCVNGHTHQKRAARIVRLRTISLSTRLTSLALLFLGRDIRCQVHNYFKCTIRWYYFRSVQSLSRCVSL